MTDPVFNRNTAKYSLLAPNNQTKNNNKKAVSTNGKGEKIRSLKNRHFMSDKYTIIS